MKRFAEVLFKPEAHRFLYVLLLIATPFLLLQNYLQSFIGSLSDIGLQTGNTSIAVLPLLVAVLVLTLVFRFRKQLTATRILAWLAILLMFWVGQLSTDFYFNHRFYDLQYNWHYFAYAIFAWLNFRVMKRKHAPDRRIIGSTFVLALLISTFDEVIQVPLSNRIFDVGDIAKDLWGSMIGLSFVYFVYQNGRLLKNGVRLWQPKLKAYFKDPLSLFFLQLILAWIFMFVSSITTDSKYLFVSFFASLFLFVIFFILFHLSGSGKNRIFLIVAVLVLGGLQSFFYLKHAEDNITYCNNGLVVYKGIPLFFFDVLIYPDGAFRLVDKKKYFNKRDQATIRELAGNILIIGTGEKAEGGAGWINDPPTGFVYNEFTEKGLQVIVLDSRQACREFNRLKREKLRPMLILHNE